MLRALALVLGRAFRPLNVILRLVTEVGPSSLSVGRADLGDVGISVSDVVGFGVCSGEDEEGVSEIIDDGSVG